MRTTAFRLGPGSDLRLELERIARERGLKAGCVVTCVGSLARARLRMPGRPGAAEDVIEVEGPMEIVSLAGTLSPDGPHLHIALSLRHGACMGGHLVEGCVVHTTAEVVLGELEGVAFRRVADPATGYLELKVEDGDLG